MWSVSWLVNLFLLYIILLMKVKTEQRFMVITFSFYVYTLLLMLLLLFLELVGHSTLTIETGTDWVMWVDEVKKASPDFPSVACCSVIGKYLSESVCVCVSLSYINVYHCYCHWLVVKCNLSSIYFIQCFLLLYSNCSWM